MPHTATSSRAARTARPTTAAPTAERRSRRRLRELCDEVLASWRAAQGRELFSDEDRRVGREMVLRLAGR